MAISKEETVFEHVDDVNGETYIDVWTNGVGDLHVAIVHPEKETASIYIRNGEKLGKAILKAVWS